MLFNSYIFIFAFLPVTVVGYHFLIELRQRDAAFCWLILASLFFYGWWDPQNLFVILTSVFLNYTCYQLLRKKGNPLFRSVLLALGIAGNILALSYYKYTTFFLGGVADEGLKSLINVALPLAISFFTFQQIAFLVDVRNDKVGDVSLIDYLLFVTFFPQLIAGPIVHHSAVMPQFQDPPGDRWISISLGLCLFVFGLSKKIIIADSIAPFATSVFDAAANDVDLTFWEAWWGALLYHYQIYFDFSGYSDMAIGLGFMFLIRLPVNFFSPYKSLSIIEFWRRWHMTLSRFLRDYLYIPLGGSRGSELLKSRNLIITMLLGGLWHGAGWTFILWGGLHGIFLLVNHAWRQTSLGMKLADSGSIVWRCFSHLLTMVCVIVAWVYFRASSMQEGNRIVSTMFGMNGISLPKRMELYLGSLDEAIPGLKFKFTGILGETLTPVRTEISWWVPTLVLVTALMPNAIQIIGCSQTESTFGSKYALKQHHYLNLVFRPNYLWAITLALLLVAALASLDKYTEFLYFNF